MIWTTLIGIVFANPPTDVVALDHIQAIEIEQSFRYSWNAGQRSINSATILVIEIPKDKTGLPQVGAPVLYVGTTPAARPHPGGTDQHIVVFVEGHPDMSKTPIFWGPDTLPEQVTDEMGSSFQTASGQPPFPTDEIQMATQDKIRVKNETEMYGHIAHLIETFAPNDIAFAQSIRVTMEQ